MKDSRKMRLTEGTGNFVPPPNGLPLLVGMTLEEYDNYVELYGEDDYTPECIVLDSETIASIQDDISNFLTELSDYNTNTYYSDDDEPSYETYTTNMYAIRDGNEYLIELVDGYYEGVQVLVRRDFNDLSSDLKKKVEDFLDYLQFKYALTKVSVSNTSNGEQFISKQSDDYVDLDESKKAREAVLNLKKKVYTYAILTPENPNLKVLTDEERREYTSNPLGYNKKKVEQLKNLLRDGAINGVERDGDNISPHIPYVQIRGSYGKQVVETPDGEKIILPPEHFFMLLNLQESEVEGIAEMFKQQSFIYGINHEDGTREVYTYTMKYSKSGKTIVGYNKQGKLINPTSDPSNQTASDYYSKSKGYKWSFEFTDDAWNDEDIDLDEIWDIEDDEAIKESLTENSAFRRFNKRKQAYKLNESNKVSKALWGDYYNKIRTFAIISTERPLVMTMNVSSNRKRTELLKKYLKDGMFQAIEVDGEVVQDIVNNFGEKEEFPNYKKIDGMYEESEHSFMIMNISLKSAKAIAKTFGQESFFYGKVSQVTDNMKDYKDATRATTATIEYWKATKIVKNKDLSPTISDYKLIEVSNRVDSVDDALSYYSKHKGNKFTIKMKEFESLHEIMNEEYLEQSLDDSVSGKNQYFARQLAYKKK